MKPFLSENSNNVECGKIMNKFVSLGEKFLFLTHFGYKLSKQFKNIPMKIRNPAKK